MVLTVTWFFVPKGEKKVALAFLRIQSVNPISSNYHTGFPYHHTLYDVVDV